MPRPKIDEKFRRRIAHACRYCKAKKQKCDGKSPCVQCVKHSRPSACEYAPRENTSGLLRRRRWVQVETEDINGVSRSEEVQPTVPLDVRNTGELRQRDIARKSNEEFSELVVPRRSQVLYNSKGEASMFNKVYPS
jgi:hypothetical protein